MSYLIKPKDYKALLDLKQTELGIKQIKDFFFSRIYLQNSAYAASLLPYSY